MPSPAPTADDATTPSALNSDLPCGECGYNLRTMALDGVCPECGRAVQDSFLPAEFNFESFARIRRTKLGIAVWVLAFALPATGVSIVALSFLARPLWTQLGELNPAYLHVQLLAVRIWGYADKAGVLCNLAAVLLITMQTRRRLASKPWLGWIAVAAALVGVPSRLIHFRTWLPAPVATAAFELSEASLVASVLLCWVFLTLQLDRRRSRRLRLTMWIVLLAPILFVVEMLALAFLRASMSRWAGGSIFEPPTWLWTCFEVSKVWAKYGAAICYVIMALVLWAYIRKLDRALKP